MSRVNTLTATPSNLRLNNQSAILSELLQHGRISRSRLAEHIGVSATTITKIVTELIELGLVEDAPQLDTPTTLARVGRPRTALQLIPDSRYAIGIYIRTGLMDVGITNLKAKLVQQFEVPFDVTESPESLFQQVMPMITDRLQEARIGLDHVVGIGIGAQGRVDAETGVNVFAPNLRWRSVPIADIVAQLSPLPIRVDNNIRLMALGEARFGGHRDIDNLAFLHVEGGVGAGFIVDGSIYHGADATAGEIGHTTILPENGDLCSCGNHGCLETLISEDAIVDAARRIAKTTEDRTLLNCLDDEQVDTLDCIFEAARSGNGEIMTMLLKRADYMGIAVANLINLMNPELILLGGRIYAKGADLLMPITQQTIEDRSFADLGKHVQVKIVSPESKPGLVGSAGLALDRFFYRQYQSIN